MASKVQQISSPAFGFSKWEQWPVETTDSNYLLSVFPAEIWTMIINMNTKPQHLEALSNASNFFRDLLFEKRKYFLFPGVWNVLCRNKEAMLSGQLLSLRQVCASWNSTIECFYQNNSMHFSLQNSENLDNNVAAVVLEKYENTARFLGHFASSSEQEQHSIPNPFLGRSLVLNCSTLNQNDGSEFALILRDARNLAFLVGLVPLLRKFGHHVWYLTLKGSCFNIVSLLRCLENLPNLKVLKLVTVVEEPFTLDRFAELREELSEISIPKITTLQYINANDVPEIVLDKVLAVNNHVIQLKLGCSYDSSVATIVDKNLSNITRFSLDSLSSLIEVELLSEIGKNWKLKELHLKVDSAEYFRIVALIESTWGKSLHTLDLDLCP